jgi:hypothetical protein
MASHFLSQPRPHAGKSPLAREAREPAAQYIAQMAAELAEIAERAQLDLLTYFLKMAQMEAEAYLRGEE